MKIPITGFAVLIAVGAMAGAPLTLERTIPLPGVTGRIDHMAMDAKGQRLFVAALGNNSVEVVSLAEGKVVRSIAGLAEPQGLFFLAETNRLYVANGGDGTLRIYDTSTWVEVKTIRLTDDADNLRYDEAAKRLYVGYGNALAAIDVTRNETAADIPLSAHPESFQLEKSGRRIFVNLPGSHAIAVVDRPKQMVETTWSPGMAAANFPMAFDEAGHRLFVGCRMPARLIVFDTETGKVAAKLALHGDCDDLFFDVARRQLYASCGEGFIDIFARTNADSYAPKESVKTEAKARTCFVDGERLYLAVPKRGDQAAEIRCYRLQPPSP